MHTETDILALILLQFACTKLQTLLGKTYEFDKGSELLLTWSTSANLFLERSQLVPKKEKRKKAEQKGIRERKEGEGGLKKEKTREVVPLDKCVPATV